MMNNKTNSVLILFVLIVSVLTACTVNSGSGDILTTAVTDSQGQTHFYEPVTDTDGSIVTTEKDNGIFAEIETESNGKAVTKDDGAYITNEHTTVLPIESASDNSSSSTTSSAERSSSNETNNNADNDVSFETSSQKNTTTTTTEEKQSSTSTTQSATDEDGWINKWY